MLGNDDAFNFVSAAAVISVYGKIADNIADSKGFKRILYKIAKTAFSRKYVKAVKLYPDIAKAIENMVECQIRIEQNENIGIDEASEPTAKAMELIFALCSDNETQKRILARLGYCIGKWIYLIDAVCDLDDDIKNNCFNPLKGSDVKSALMTMNVCAAQAGAALDLLEIKRFGGILQNIVYIGLPETASCRMNGGKDNKDEKSI